VSTHVARETSHALGGADVQVLPNGIDAASWKLEPHARDPDTLRIVSVTRLQVRKRPRDLFTILDDAQRALGDSVRLTLDIIGDGRERFFIDRLAERAGADRVTVHGRLSREEIRDVFRRADVFVLPTRMESFGIAALEAMCAGLPVVARRNTGVEDFIVHGENGLLGENVEELTTAVVDLARNEPLRAAIAARNHTAHPPFAWSDIVRSAEAQYERARRLQHQR
jgi:glycosyltransferase involved in cell wall biosynthesis